jgi:hypothetical protein
VDALDWLILAALLILGAIAVIGLVEDARRR